MAASTVNAPAKKDGAGGAYTWGKAEDVTDYEPVGVRDSEKVSVARSSPADGTEQPASPEQAPVPDRNNSTEFPKLEAPAAPPAQDKEGSTDKEKKKAKEKEAVANSLVVASGLFMTAVTMTVPSRAPMVLAIKRGDAAGTARTMGLMSSCAAVLELFLNPILGRLSDKYGRKPFLLMAPLVNACLRMGVVAFPRTLAVTFVDRMISGAMIFAYLAPLNAALVDIFGTGQKLGETMARSGSLIGVGCALGPFIGAKLGGARSFFLSGLTYAVTALWLSANCPETLNERRKKEFDWSACSPLAFIKLFRNRMTAMLSTTLGLQSFGDYANVYDINFLFMKTVMGYGQAEVGNFATAVGITQIAGGEAMRKFIRSFGQKSATLYANLLWIVSFGILGTSRSAAQLALSLVVMTFGHQRSTAVRTYLQKHAQATGMGAAEVQGAQANLLAVLKVVVPIMYGNLFAWATSKGMNMPGLPYFIVGALTACSQLTFSSIDPDK